MNTCKNCEKEVVGKHCSNCGQKTSVAELSIKELIHEFWHSITHTDKGILSLIKGLFLHPKKVYLEYFSGKRKKYFSPITFFLITAAILLFLGTKIFDYEDYIFKVFNEFGRYSLKVTKFKVLILLPFEIFATYFIFYKQHNLAKNIVFWIFLNGHLFLIKILFTPLYFIFIKYKIYLDNVVSLIQFGFVFIHLALVFGNKKWLRIFLCILITFVLIILDYVVTGYMLFGDKFISELRF